MDLKLSKSESSTSSTYKSDILMATIYGNCYEKIINHYMEIKGYKKSNEYMAVIKYIKADDKIMMAYYNSSFATEIISELKEFNKKASTMNLEDHLRKYISGDIYFSTTDPNDINYLDIAKRYIEMLNNPIKEVKISSKEMSSISKILSKIWRSKT